MKDASHIRGPIDNRFDLPIGTVNRKDLAERIRDTLKFIGDVEISQIQDGRLLQAEYSSKKDSSFRAHVTLYDPKELDTVETVGVYVYSDNIGTRNRAFHRIWHEFDTKPEGYQPALEPHLKLVK